MSEISCSLCLSDIYKYYGISHKFIIDFNENILIVFDDDLFFKKIFLILR